MTEMEEYMINVPQSSLKRDREMAELFPVKKNYLYFNYASDGPLPTPARSAFHFMNDPGEIERLTGLL